MKTMFLTLAAVLGLSLGAASLSPVAHADTQQVFHAPNGGNR
jgi:hypothetical protein